MLQYPTTKVPNFVMTAELGWFSGGQHESTTTFLPVREPVSFTNRFE